MTWNEATTAWYCNCKYHGVDGSSGSDGSSGGGGLELQLQVLWC